MEKYVYLAIVTITLMHSFAYAKTHNLEVSNTKKFVFDESTWSKGTGSFIPNTTKLNIFSHKKKKEFQVLYEDLFIPKVELKNRLPKECSNLVAESGFGQLTCKYYGSTPKDKHSVQYTTVFKVSKKNIVKVRTVYIIGKKPDVEDLAKQVDLNSSDEAKR